jgi:hypothetical protein
MSNAVAPPESSRIVSAFGQFQYAIFGIAVAAAIIALVMKRKKMACFAPSPEDVPCVHFSVCSCSLRPLYRWQGNHTCSLRVCLGL